MLMMFATMAAGEPPQKWPHSTRLDEAISNERTPLYSRDNARATEEKRKESKVSATDGVTKSMGTDFIFRRTHAVAYANFSSTQTSVMNI